MRLAGLQLVEQFATSQLPGWQIQNNPAGSKNVQAGRIITILGWNSKY
jgi:hypothetical protein